VKCFAVIGMGSIAKRHAINLRALHPTAKIFVVSSSGKNTELPNGIDAVINIDDLLAYRPNYVIVASPAPFHTTMAKILLENGIAVLIEKPLTINYESALDFEIFCQKITAKVAIGYCLRFLPSAQIVKEYINNGQLGTLYNVECNVGQYLPDWRTDKNYKESVSANKVLGGGVLLELSHEVDFLLWILGDLTLKHSWLRTTNELGLDVEEIADLVLTSREGAYISLHLDFIQKSTQRKCEFIGKNGRLVWDLVGNSVRLHQSNNVTTLYADADYDKNNMYIDMLSTFEHVGPLEFEKLATVSSSAKVVRLIDEAKRFNRWSIV
jgi:predicted dehydrogenase